MGSVGTKSWLEKLEEETNIDLDWLDPTFTKTLPIVPHDMTSNQLWVDIQMNHPDNEQLVRNVIQEYKGKGWLAMYTKIAVLLTKENINNIQGRVLLQVLPSEAYNIRGVINHGRMYAEEFAKAGISKDRYCIKIPSTGAGLNGAKVLESEGIRTLGTAVFCLEQAIACSQAGCLYISPYFNEVRAHDVAELWPNVADPAIQHPNSPRIVQILEIYKRLYKETGKEQPLLKNASFVTPQEALASGEMGCHSITVSPQVLTELAKLPYDASKQPSHGKPKPAHAYANAGPLSARMQSLTTIDPLAAPGWDGKLPSIEKDYLANLGSELQKAILADGVAQQRLDDALDLFKGGEARSRVKIEAMITELEKKA